MKSARSYFSLFLITPATAWITAFGVLPLFLVILVSLRDATPLTAHGSFSIENYVAILTDPIYSVILLSTIVTAATATVITLVVSYPVAWFLSRQRGLRQAFFLILVFLPFWSSYVIRTYAWLPILGRQGIVNSTLMGIGIIDEPITWLLYSKFAVYIGLTYVYMLYMLLPLNISLSKIDDSTLDAAKDLGASRFQIVRRIILPLSAPGIFAGCAMVFLLNTGTYITPQMLGGPNAMMFGNLIAMQFEMGNWALGSAMATILVLFVFVLFGVIGKVFGLQKIFGTEN